MIPGVGGGGKKPLNGGGEGIFRNAWITGGLHQDVLPHQKRQEREARKGVTPVQPCHKGRERGNRLGEGVTKRGCSGGAVIKEVASKKAKTRVKREITLSQKRESPLHKKLGQEPKGERH